jgi:hypothetical protein
MHVLPIITKIVTSRYNSIIIVANMNTKYSSHRQYGYKYSVIANMDKTIRVIANMDKTIGLMNA